jgi:hypothetical protein
VSSHLSNGVSNYEGLPSFLPTSFSLFPSQNPSPQEFRSLQDLRCSNSIQISPTKTWEQHFPRFTPSALPRGQHYHLLSILHRSLCPFYARRSPHRFVWSCFDHMKLTKFGHFYVHASENVLSLTSPFKLTKTRYRALRRKLPPHAEAMILCEAGQQQIPSAGTMCVHTGVSSKACGNCLCVSGCKFH